MIEEVTYRGVEIQIDDLERPYFEAAAQGRLIVQACLSCHVVRYPPTYLCAACGSADYEWRDTNGAGRLTACLIVEHGVRETFKPPYALGLVSLDEVPGSAQPGREVRILTTVLAADGGPQRDVLPDGTAVSVHFEPLTDTLALPQFRVVE